MIENSTAIISACSFYGQDGAWGYDADPAYDGGPSLQANESTVYFQASSGFGGNGGNYTDYSGWMLGPGDGGHGVELHFSDMHIFGRAKHELDGGNGGASNYGVWGKSGRAIAATHSTVAYSGITLQVPKIHCLSSTITEVLPSVPVITLDGSGLLNETIEPVLYGLPDSMYVLFFSPGQGAFPLGGKYTHLLLDPALLFLLAGGTIPAGPPPSYLLPIPPEASVYLGAPIHFQAYVITHFGKTYLSTSATFALR